jgi:hypothetical protein
MTCSSHQLCGHMRLRMQVMLVRCGTVVVVVVMMMMMMMTMIVVVVVIICTKGIHSPCSQPYLIQVSGCCRDGGSSASESVHMVVGARFDGGGQPCMLALPWFLPVAPSITVPLPPSCTAAFASTDLSSSSSSSSSGPIIGSHLRSVPSASVTIHFDADVDVGE